MILLVHGLNSLVAKPEDMSYILMSHVVEEENWILQVVL